MTTYSAIFTLIGHEVIAYRYLLTHWQRHVEAQGEAEFRKVTGIDRGHLLKEIQLLTQATYVSSGESAPVVTDVIREHHVCSLESAIHAPSADLDLSKEQLDKKLLSVVLRKITSLRLSSWRGT